MQGGQLKCLFLWQLLWTAPKKTVFPLAVWPLWEGRCWPFTALYSLDYVHGELLWNIIINIFWLHGLSGPLSWTYQTLLFRNGTNIRYNLQLSLSVFKIPVESCKTYPWVVGYWWGILNQHPRRDSDSHFHVFNISISFLTSAGL